MKILVSLLSIWIFIKNLSYGIYEYKMNKNVVGSCAVIIFNLVCLIFGNVVLFFT